MYKKASHLGIVLGVFMGMLLIGTSVSAAESNGKLTEDTPAPTSETAAPAIGSDAGYEFSARSGDSLSLITRKAIQLYVKAEDVELSAAEAMYCETNLTQKLGNRYLEIGEKVTVSFANLKECVEASSKLNATQQSARGEYAAQADQSVTGPDPQNADANPSDTENEGEQSDTSEENTEDENTDDQSQNDDSDQTVSWYWWVLVIAVIGVLYYLFSDRFKSDNK